MFESQDGQGCQLGGLCGGDYVLVGMTFFPATFMLDVSDGGCRERPELPIAPSHWVLYKRYKKGRPSWWNLGEREVGSRLSP